MPVVVVVAIAVLGPWLVGDPLARDLDHGLGPDGGPLGIGAGAGWLGTDPLGRDVWARLVCGAGSTLIIATGAAVIAVVVGAAVGVAAGLASAARGRAARWVDELLMRSVDLVLAFPYLLLAILLAALLRESAWGGTRLPAILTLGAVGWTTAARVMRAKAAAIAGAEYALAARALGAGPWRLAWRHVLPNAAGALAVVASLAFAQAILAESLLGYLGLGPPPPAPTWGRMLYEGRAYYRTAPHLVAAPALAIVLAVLAFTALAEAARRRFGEAR